MLMKQVLVDQYRFLTFRSPSAVIREHPGVYLAFGLCLTWLAGVGRYWDSANATLWQHAGLGSVAYVLAFAGLLWLVAAPLAPRNWTYRTVLLFVTLTAPPALLYAVPVEKFLEPATAHAVNVTFLAVVALWRIALLFVFLRRGAGLSGFAILIAGLLPLALIVDGLSLANLGPLVYQTMAGIDHPDQMSDGAGTIVVQLIGTIAAALTPMLLAGYCYLAFKAHTLRAFSVPSAGAGEAGR